MTNMVQHQWRHCLVTLCYLCLVCLGSVLGWQSVSWADAGATIAISVSGVPMLLYSCLLLVAATVPDTPVEGFLAALALTTACP